MRWTRSKDAARSIASSLERTGPAPIAAEGVALIRNLGNEIRALQGGLGQQEAVSMILTDSVEDPFRDALASGMHRLQESSMFDYPTGIPDLVMQSMAPV